MNFDFNEEKEKLSSVNDELYDLFNNYDNILNSLSNREKNIMDLYYYFRRLNTFKEMTPDGNYWDNKREAFIQRLTNVINKLGHNTFGNFNDFDELKKIVDISMNGKLLNIINDFSADIKNIYKKHIDHVYTVLPVSGLEELEASKHRENRYLNSINDGVFASTSFDSIEKYIGRANVGGLIANGNQLEYPANPFSRIEDDKLMLTEPVSIYLGNVDLFEPQFDYIVDNRGFSHFTFDGEWIAPYEKINCIETQTDYLPISFIEENDVYYYEGNEKIQINEKSKSL
jgi:hypothetical protein